MTVKKSVFFKNKKMTVQCWQNTVSTLWSYHQKVWKIEMTSLAFVLKKELGIAIEKKKNQKF